MAVGKQLVGTLPPPSGLEYRAEYPKVKILLLSPTTYKNLKITLKQSSEFYLNVKINGDLFLLNVANLIESI